MRYLSYTLIATGLLILYVTGWRATDPLQRNRGFTLGLALMTLGTLVNNITAQVPFTLGMYGLLLIVFAAMTTHTALRSALPCLIGRHGDTELGHCNRCDATVPQHGRV